MSDVDRLSKEEIGELARQAYYNLREHLITLRFSPPQEIAALTMLQNRVASLMRTLDEYHSCLFVEEKLAGSDIKITADEYLEQDMRRIKEYQEWRLRKLAGPESGIQSEDANMLRLENTQRWRKIFLRPLYDSPSFNNHWHITTKRSVGGSDVWCDLGDTRTDLTFAHIVASHRRGHEVQIFYCAEIDIGGTVVNYGRIEDYLPTAPKGITNNGLPQVTIEPNGAVSFDMKI